MPKIAVEIEWDYPEDPNWLCPDNVLYCLQNTCKTTHFRVKQIENIIEESNLNQEEISTIVEEVKGILRKLAFIKPDDEWLAWAVAANHLEMKYPDKYTISNVQAVLNQI